MKEKSLLEIIFSPPTPAVSFRVFQPDLYSTLGENDIQTELLPLVQNKRHFGYRGAQSGYPAAIKCSLDEEA
ncbi:hypothetical protein J6590_044336 [Homalodisca vitripennis]|nr:hypothetical protein J6590_044336 [Homalodisca vitripennis]